MLKIPQERVMVRPLIELIRATSQQVTRTSRNIDLTREAVELCATVVNCLAPHQDDSLYTVEIRLAEELRKTWTSEEPNKNVERSIRFLQANIPPFKRLYYAGASPNPFVGIQGIMLQQRLGTNLPPSIVEAQLSELEGVHQEYLMARFGLRNGVFLSMDKIARDRGELLRDVRQQDLLAGHALEARLMPLQRKIDDVLANTPPKLEPIPTEPIMAASGTIGELRGKFGKIRILLPELRMSRNDSLPQSPLLIATSHNNALINELASCNIAPFVFLASKSSSLKLSPKKVTELEGLMRLVEAYENASGTPEAIASTVFPVLGILALGSLVASALGTNSYAIPYEVVEGWLNPLPGKDAILSPFERKLLSLRFAQIGGKFHSTREVNIQCGLQSPKRVEELEQDIYQRLGEHYLRSLNAALNKIPRMANYAITFPIVNL